MGAKSVSLFRPSFQRLAPYLVPAILIYGFCAILPIIGAFRYSLYTDLEFKLKYVGLANYLTLIFDSDFWLCFGNNMILVSINFVFQIVLAFIIAIWMHSKLVVLRDTVRILLFFPAILSAIVVSFLWMLIYNVDYGMLNVFLKAVHLQSWTRAWLSDPDIVIFAVVVVTTWQYTGFFVVIFLAGLTNIPEELIEAAEIDGASISQRTVHVTLPLMSGTWRAVLILSTANGMKLFEHPFVLTGGGPGLHSAVLAIYAYNNLFFRSNLSYGSTVSIGTIILSFALIGAITLLADRLVLRRGNGI
jgi:raffinose/stachyose/melibiose transport system permease protein